MNTKSGLLPILKDINMVAVGSQIKFIFMIGCVAWFKLIVYFVLTLFICTVIMKIIII